MVAIFTGLGAGFERGSGSILGGAGLLGSASLGRNKEQVLLNAANGNLMINQQDEFLVGLGPDSAIGRTYNSIESVSDGDNGDHWRQSTTRAVHGLTGTLNTAGSTIKRTSGDGSDITYTYQTINGTSAYFATDGSGAYDKLVNASGAWTWTDGDTQFTESYAAYGTDNWRIIQAANVIGLTLTFTYTGANLTQVTTQDGSYEQYSWSGGNISQIVTGYTDLVTSTAKTLTRTRYGYDSYNRLTTVTIDLSPGDNSVTDGATYVTTYQYKSNTSTDPGFRQIGTISETDGSSITIHYDSSGRVDTLTQSVAGAVTRATGIVYGAGSTTITDSLGQVTTLEYNSDGSLTKVTSPPGYSGATAQYTQFAYTADGKGNLWKVIDALGGVTTYTYDSSGNVLTVTDPLNNVVTRTYGSMNEMLTETRTGSDAGSAGASHTTRYIYGVYTTGVDNLLSAKVDAEGRVTVYVYGSIGGGPSGLVSQEKQYNDALYDISPLASTDPITRAQISAFLGSMATKANTVNTTYTRDARGDVTLIRTTSSANASAGGGDTTQPYAVTNYVYDQAGQLLNRTGTGFNTETFVYDGMGRITAATDLNGGTTSFLFQDSAMTTVVTLASGLTQTSVYNKAGELVSFAESGTNVTGGTATYAYDQRGQLRVTTDATGHKSYIVYDKTGRKIADVDHYGHLIEYKYDADDRLVATIRYTNDVASQLTTLQDPNSNVEISTLRPAATSTDLWTWKIYDADSRVVETIDGAGDVTEYQYDASGQLIGTTIYANKLTSTELAWLKAAPAGFAANRLNNSQLDGTSGWGIGYNPNNIVNGGSPYTGVSNGKSYIKIDFTATASNQVTSIATYDPWFPVTAGERFAVQAAVEGQGAIGTLKLAVWWHDINGNSIGSSDIGTLSGAQASNTKISGFATAPTGAVVGRLELYMTSSAAGTGSFDFTEPMVSAATATQTAMPTFTPTPVADSAHDSVARTFYDKTGLLIGVLDGEGYLTGFTYDKVGRKIAQTAFATITTSGLRASGTFSALVTSVTTVINPADRTTRYVYDGQSHLRFQIDALNRVTEYIYDSGTAGQANVLRETIQYAGTISALSDYKLATVKAAVAVVAGDSNNHKSWAVYDSAGRLAYAIDATGAVNGYSYDTLGNVTKTVQFATLRATTTLPDLATMASWQTANTVSTDRITRNYYSARNELRYTVDAEGFVTRIDYDAEGRATTSVRWDTAITTSDSTTIALVASAATGASTTTSTSYDNDGRVDTTTDGATIVTKYVYNSNGTLAYTYRAYGLADQVRTDYFYDGAGRVLTRRDATGAAEQSDTSYTYDGLGDVVTITDPLGNSTYSYYDRLGRLVSTRDAENYVTEMAYTSFGEVASVTRRGNKATNTASVSTLPVYTPDATKDATSYSYYNILGQVTATRDAEDYVTEYSYTSFGEISSTTRRANKATNTASATALPTYIPDSAKDVSSYSYYDMLGRVTTTRDAESNVTEFAYNAFGNTVSVTRRANKATNTAATSTLPVYGTNAVNDATSFSYYNRRGQVTTSRDAENYVTEIAYNAAGDAVSVTRRANKATDTASATTLPVYIADAVNDATSYTYYNHRSQVTATLDAEGCVTETSYNARGEVISFTRRANKANNGASALTLPTYTADSAKDQTSYLYRDHLGRVTTTRDAEGYVVETAYNAAGAVVSVMRRANAATNTASATVLPTYAVDPAKDAASYNYYDKLGRLTTTRDAESDVTEIAYDALGSIVSVTRRANKATNTASASTLPVYAVDPAKDAISYSYYDRLGRLISSRDAMSFVAETAYDAVGNVVSVKRRWNAATNIASATALPTYAVDSVNDAASYRYYDRLGQLVASRDAENYVTEIAYDARGNTVSVTRRANKATNTASASTLPAYIADAAHDITTYSYYDRRSLLTTRRDAASFVTEMTYNARGDVVLTTRRANAATNTASATVLPVYTADAARDASSYFYYDRLGQLKTTRDDESWVTENSYNAFGQLSATTRRANKANNTASIAVLPTYVADSAHDTTTSYEYYRTGRLKKTIEAELDPVAGGGAYYYEQYTYDALGDRLSVRDAVGAVTTFEYDRLGRIAKSIDAEIDPTVAGGTTHYFEQYTYDALGNRWTVRNKLGGTTTYYYDLNGRMSSEVLPTSSVASDGTVVATTVTNTYGYDARGNLKQKIEAAGLAEARVTTYYYNRLDRLTETDHTVENNINTATVGTHESINYDANGNVIEKIDQLSARTLFYYDTLNRVTVQISATGTYTTFAYTNDTGVGSTQTVRIYATQLTTAQLAAISSPPTTTPPAVPSGTYRETVSNYDKLGRLTSTTVSNAFVGAWNGSSYSTLTGTLTTSYQYDANGNVVKTTQPSTAATYTYYDRMGRKIAQVDPKLYLTTWALDGNGNVLTEVRAFNAATSVSTAGYTAGAANTADRTTKFTYDKDGRRLTEQRISLDYYTIDANSGALTLVAGGNGDSNDVGTSKIIYTYNGLGEVVSKTEATGDAHTYAYDSAGRLTSEARASYADYSSGTDTPTIRYFYNGLGDLTRTQQGGATANNTTDHITRYSYLGGRQTAMIDAAGNVHNYYYDTVGRKYGEAYYRVKADGTTMLHEGIAYRYDLDGNLIRQAFSNVSSSGVFTDAGDVTTLAYNAYGELTSRSLTGYGGSTAVVQEQYAYDNVGHMWASNSGDGVWRYYVYDANGNQTLKLEDEGKAGVNLVNRATIGDILAIATANSTTTVGATYIDGINATVTVYDARNQQTSVSQKKRQLSAAATTTAATADLTTSRTYNAFGEAITDTDARGYTTTYSYNAMGRTTSVQRNAVSFENTNLTTTSITPTDNYYYDRSGRLIGQQDANGNRITQLLLAGTSYGDATAMVVKEFHPDGGILSNGYDVYGDMRDAADALNHHTSNAYDALGRLTQVTHPTAPAGTLIDYYAYDVLGQRTQAWNNQLVKPIYGPPEDVWIDDGDGNSHVETQTPIIGYTPDKQLIDYDIQGRVVSQAAIGGDTTTMVYSWLGTTATTGLGTFGAYTRTTTYANSKTLTEVFDGFGHAISKTDLGSHATSYAYDTAGRAVSRTLSGAGTSARDNVAYTYLNTGLVSTVISGTVGNIANEETFDNTTTAYTYDALGNKLTENSARAQGYMEDHGYWTEGGGQDPYWISDFQYVTSSLTLQSATATYDELGRMKTWSEAGNTVTPGAGITWTYDAVGNVRHEVATYHALDVSNGTASSTLSTQNYWYAYDSQNHVTTSKGVVSGGLIVRGTQGVDIQYNAAGQRMKTFTTVSTYGSIYDPYGDPENGGGSMSIAYNQDRGEIYSYSANGTLANVSVAQSGYTDNYNGTYTLTSLPTTGVVKSTFTYDLMGRMTRQQDWTGNGAGVALDRQIYYNNSSQVYLEYSVSLQGSDTWSTYINTYFGGGSSYALGAAVSVLNTSSKNGGSSTTSQTVSTYDWYDGPVQQLVTYKPDYTQSATSQTSYSNSGTGTLLSAYVGGAGSHAIYVISDAQGQAIRRDVTSYNTPSPHEIWYRFNGKQLGYVGNNGTTNTDYQSSIDMRGVPAATGTPGPFRNGAFSGSVYADFDQNYDAINSFSQGSGSGTYTVQFGDTLSSIAARLWGDSSLWYKLAEANGISANFSLVNGQTLLIPAGVTRNSNNASTFRPYNSADAYGDTSPTAPAPPPAKKGCGFLGQIFLLIIAVAVTIWASPASPGIWQAVLAAGAGSLASQGVGLITGIQKKFDFKGLALSVISAGVTAGLGELASVGGKAASGLAKTIQNVGKFLNKGGFISNVARGALGSAITQGIGVATGLQQKFDWTGVAAAGIGAGVGAAAGKAAGKAFHLNLATNGPNGTGGYKNLLDGAVYRTVSGAAAGLASAATRSVIDGTDFGDNVIAALPDAIASTIGSAIGDAINKKNSGSVINYEPEAPDPLKHIDGLHLPTISGPSAEPDGVSSGINSVIHYEPDAPNSLAHIGDLHLPTISGASQEPSAPKGGSAPADAGGGGDEGDIVVSATKLRPGDPRGYTDVHFNTLRFDERGSLTTMVSGEAMAQGSVLQHLNSQTFAIFRAQKTGKDSIAFGQYAQDGKVHTALKNETTDTIIFDGVINPDTANAAYVETPVIVYNPVVYTPTEFRLGYDNSPRFVFEPVALGDKITFGFERITQERAAYQGIYGYILSSNPLVRNVGFAALARDSQNQGSVARGEYSEEVRNAAQQAHVDAILKHVDNQLFWLSLPILTMGSLFAPEAELLPLAAVRFGFGAKAAETAEASAIRQLDAMQAATAGAHFVERHGAQLTLSSQLERVAMGINPTTGVLQRSPVSATRFLSATDQLSAIKQAEQIFATTGDRVLAERPIDFGRVIGEGYNRSSGYGTQTSAQVYLNLQGKAITAFPVF